MATGSVRITISVSPSLGRRNAGTQEMFGHPGLHGAGTIRGRRSSVRSDIYALGLILYELFTGKRPVDISDPQALLRLRQSAPPRAPSALVPDLAPGARARDSPVPGSRSAPATGIGAERRRGAGWRATALAADRPPRSPLTPRKKTWRVAATIGAVLIAAAVAAILYARPVMAHVLARQLALTNRDAIVMADFENRTGEPVFDGALKVALAVALEQSPFIKIYPDDRVHETFSG